MGILLSSLSSLSNFIINLYVAWKTYLEYSSCLLLTFNTESCMVDVMFVDRAFKLRLNIKEDSIIQ